MGEFIDPEEVESIVEKCIQAMFEDDRLFTAWEVTFLEQVECDIEEKPITPKQWEKLQEIYEEKVS